MPDIFKPNYTLKKDFICEEGREIYKKGCLVFIPKLHRKHAGFCCNVFFLTKNGNIRHNRTASNSLAIFSKDFFKPKKDWFDPIKEVI